MWFMLKACSGIAIVVMMSQSDVQPPSRMAHDALESVVKVCSAAACTPDHAGAIARAVGLSPDIVATALLKAAVAQMQPSATARPAEKSRPPVDTLSDADRKAPPRLSERTNKP